MKKRKKAKTTGIPNMSPEELDGLAIDLFKGLVFTNLHCQSADEVGSSFMVLKFMDGKDVVKIKDDVGMIYEYMDKAGPMAVNGKPMFWSAQFLNKHDAKIVISKWDALREKVPEIVKAE